MKAVTSVTMWNDSVGKRMSITYSEINEMTGEISADNKRIDRVITDSAARGLMDNILAIAQSFVDASES